MGHLLRFPLGLDALPIPGPAEPLDREGVGVARLGKGQALAFQVFPVDLNPFGCFLGCGVPVAIEVHDIKRGVPWIVGEPDRPQPGLGQGRVQKVSPRGGATGSPPRRPQGVGGIVATCPCIFPRQEFNFRQDNILIFIDNYEKWRQVVL